MVSLKLHSTKIVVSNLIKNIKGKHYRCVLCRCRELRTIPFKNVDFSSQQQVVCVPEALCRLQLLLFLRKNENFFMHSF